MRPPSVRVHYLRRLHVQSALAGDYRRRIGDLPGRNALCSLFSLGADVIRFVQNVYQSFKA